MPIPYSALEFVQKAHAAPGVLKPAGSEPNSTTDNLSLTGTVGSVADKVISIFFFVAGVAGVLFILWSGLRYITSGGSPETTKTARNAVVNVIIGIILMFATYWLLRLAIGFGRSAFPN